MWKYGVVSNKVEHDILIRVNAYITQVRMYLMQRVVIIGIAVVVVVVVLAVLLFSGVVKLGAPTGAAFTSPSNISDFLSASQSAYSSASPFNFSYAFSIPSAGKAIVGSNSLPTNSSFYIAKYGSSFVITYNAFYGIMNSSNTPSLPVGLSLAYNSHTAVAYNGTLTDCSHFFVSNVTSVNSSEQALLDSMDARSSPRCSYITVASNETPFDIADLLATLPFAILTLNNTPRPFSESIAMMLAGATVSYQGQRSYLGKTCYNEEFSPPSNTTGGNTIALKTCVSVDTGLPLYVGIYQNGTLIYKDEISAVNAPPSGSLSTGAV